MKTRIIIASIIAIAAIGAIADPVIVPAPKTYKAPVSIVVTQDQLSAFLTLSGSVNNINIYPVRSGSNAGSFNVNINFAN